MFYYTTKDQKHSHVAFLDKATGTGQTSEDKGHSHRISYQQGQPEAIDPATGQGMPAIQGGLIFEPAIDGHSHRIASEIVPKEDKKAGKKTELVNECRALFKYAKELENDFRTRGEESEDFYFGKQWADDTKEKLEGEDRAALTFNEIEAKIDLLSGYQRQNRFDIKFFPVEEGDARISDILTIVSKNIDEQCNADYEETKVFEDEMIVGRGMFHTYIDYDDDIRGTIKVERFPWIDSWLGPHEKEDLSDCEHAHKGRWFSKAKAKQLYPDKADELQGWFDLFDTPKNTKGFATDNYEHPDSTSTGDIGADPDYINLAKKEIRVIETIRKEYDRVSVLANADLDVYFPAKGWKSEDIAAVKTIPGFASVPRNVTRFRVVTWAGNVLLDDTYNDLDDFPLVPVYAKKRGKRIWGKIDSAKDPQREINKRRSQVTDILNKVATYGYFYDDQTFPDDKESKKFKTNAAKPGFVQKVTDINRKPIKEEGVKFPGELVNMITMDSQLMREILNINMEMQGVGNGTMSGVAIAEKKRSGMTGNEFLFDNLSLAKRRLGRLRIKMIQKVYTPERIIRILENRSQKQEVTVAGTPWADVDKEEIAHLLQDSDLAKYDVVVGESAYSPTQRLANFAMFMEMAQRGVQLPPQLLIELSPLPEVDKQKALQQQQAMMQAQQQEQQLKYQTEMDKTMIAKGMPPGGGMPGGMQ